jgi:hypothetical protein
VVEEPAQTGVSAVPPESITLVRWADPVVDGHGHGINSPYTELFWLPVLGPSAFLLWRRGVALTEGLPQGVTVGTAALSAWLGLGQGLGRHAPLPRAIERCIRFGVARWLPADRLAVRALLAPLSHHHAQRLEPGLRQLYGRWSEERIPRPDRPQAEAARLERV